MSDKRQRMVRNWTATGSCATGKRAYFDRDAAKRDASWAKRNGFGGMRPYRCPQCGAWHIGHKPRAVIRGEVTADEFYEPVAL